MAGSPVVLGFTASITALSTQQTGTSTSNTAVREMDRRDRPLAQDGIVQNSVTDGSSPSHHAADAWRGRAVEQGSADRTRARPSLLHSGRASQVAERMHISTPDCHQGARVSL